MTSRSIGIQICVLQLLRIPTHVRTDDVLIVTRWRLSTLTQHLTWFDKQFTSTGEFYFIRDRKKIQYKYMKENNHFTQTYSQLSFTTAHGSRVATFGSPLFSLDLSRSALFLSLSLSATYRQEWCY